MYKKIEIKQIELDRKSPLYFAEHFDMNTKRFFYVLDKEKGEVRGAHAHKKTSQLIWVISGAMEIQALDDKGDILLSEEFNKYSQAILFDPYVWLNITSMKDGTSFLCLTDLEYIEEDYIRNPKNFLREMHNSIPKKILFSIPEYSDSRGVLSLVRCKTIKKDGKNIPNFFNNTPDQIFISKTNSGTVEGYIFKRIIH